MKELVKTLNDLQEDFSSLAEIIFEESKEIISRFYLKHYQSIDKDTIHELKPNTIVGWNQSLKQSKILKCSKIFLVLDVFKFDKTVWIKCFCNEGIVYFRQYDFVYLKK